MMISSELPEVLGMSDRIAVMREGKLARVFDCAEAGEENVGACALGAVQYEASDLGEMSHG